ERPIIYFVDPTKQNAPLLESIHRGKFVALHGPRASGKSTRALMLKEQVQKEGLACIYVPFEHVNLKNSVDVFWQSLGMALQRDAPELFGPLKNLSIKSATDFLNTFHRDQWKFSDTVILLDEFDMLYSATEDVRTSCLTTFHGIKASKQNYAIRSVIAIRTFSILQLNSNNLTTSLFNVNEPFRNPNFTLEQVQFLYKEFSDEYELTIDQEVIENIYVRTNGHAGLVCLCGRAIYRKLLSELEMEMPLNYDIWQRFTAFSLGYEILEYPTFIKMRDVLLKDDIDTR
ncbi:2587_t:CDS:2, partial [Cetraspora pellucida]